MLEFSAQGKLGPDTHLDNAKVRRLARAFLGRSYIISMWVLEALTLFRNAVAV